MRSSIPASTSCREFLAPGDLLVVNTSATLPAALDASLGDRAVELRLSTPAGSDAWVVELRTAEGFPFRRPPAGARLELPGDAHAELLAPYAGSDRLAVARLTLGAPLEDYLRRYGRPIRYGYVPEHWPIGAYQTVFALEPGSAEMPSAGRPFTNQLVTTLVTRGVLVAPVTLHTGVSSPELGERPYPERYRVPEATARLVSAVHGWGGRVIAVGTTVVRALETIARRDGIALGRRGLHEPRRHGGTRAARRRRAADRLARAGGVASADARSRGRGGAARTLLSGRCSSAAISGTNSGTCT